MRGGFPIPKGPPPSRDHTQLGLGCLESAAHVLLRHCRAFAVTIGLSRKAKGRRVAPKVFSLGISRLLALGPGPWCKVCKVCLCSRRSEGSS